MRYSKEDIFKYLDGYWITSWMAIRGCRVKISGPYKNKDMALLDMEVLNNRP